MSRSLPSRLLLILLAGLLQIALLPGLGRTTCMLRTASIAGCCCVEVVQQAPAPSCCESEEPGRPADGQVELSGRCDCDDGRDELLATPGLLSEVLLAKKAADVDDATRAPPPNFAVPVPGQSAPPAALRAAPPARTGPPLHVLLQVFLI